MNQQRKDQDGADRARESDETMPRGSGKDESDERASGISNRGLEREREEQDRVPERGRTKSEE